MGKITLGSGKAECLDPKEGVGLACSRARVAGARGVLVTPVLPLVKTQPLPWRRPLLMDTCRGC